MTSLVSWRSLRRSISIPSACVGKDQTKKKEYEYRGSLELCFVGHSLPPLAILLSRQIEPNDIHNFLIARDRRGKRTQTPITASRTPVHKHVGRQRAATLQLKGGDAAIPGSDDHVRKLIAACI